MGLDPRAVWDLEIWEIAAVLGVGEPDGPLDGAQGGSGPPGGSPPRDIIAERVLAAQMGLPPPEADRPDFYQGKELRI